MKVRVDHNLDEVSEELRGVLEQVGVLLARLARYADSRIAARAIGTYMRNAGFGAGRRAKGDTGPLRIVSGRLARAVKGSRTRESSVELRLNLGRLSYTKTITVPYAAIQEYGGTIRVTITRKMRRFFWAMFFDTNDDRWRRMALTRKTSFTIHIPARPYLRPAVEDELPVILERAVRDFTRAFGQSKNAET